MVHNDSDSSDDDGGSFTTTNVMLGYASREPTDDSFSQLGGYPIWPSDTIAPSAELAKCKVCNNMMTLLLQLNGDLPERFPGHERKLYIFSCKRKACIRKEGTCRAIRGIRISKGSALKSKTSDRGSTVKEEEQKKKQPSQDLGNSLFNSTLSSSNFGHNPFSISTTPQSPSTNPFTSQPLQTTPTLSSPPIINKPPSPSASDLPTTFAQKARISSPPPPQPKTSTPFPPPPSLPNPYPSYHLDADYETLDPIPSSSSSAAKTTAMEIDTEGTGAVSGRKDDDEKDAFESSIDKTFQRFADRLAQNPEQVLRYEFGGVPLLYSKEDEVGKLFSQQQQTPTSDRNAKVTTSTNIAHSSGGSGGGVNIGNRLPRCQNCSAPRVFELQLVPHAIAELEVEEEGLEGMEWGTVILGLCERDCGERGVREGEWGWVEEWVGVQWEEVGGGREGWEGMR